MNNTIALITRTTTTAVRVQHVPALTARIGDRPDFLTGKRTALAKQRATAQRRLDEIRAEIAALAADVDNGKVTAETAIKLLQRPRRIEVVLVADLERLAIKMA